MTNLIWKIVILFISLFFVNTAYSSELAQSSFQESYTYSTDVVQWFVYSSKKNCDAANWNKCIYNYKVKINNVMKWQLSPWETIDFFSISWNNDLNMICNASHRYWLYTLLLKSDKEWYSLNNCGNGKSIFNRYEWYIANTFPEQSDFIIALIRVITYPILLLLLLVILYRKYKKTH